MEKLIQVVLKHARSPLDQVPAHEVKINALTAQNRWVESADAALEILQILGLDLPRRPGKLQVVMSLLKTKLKPLLFCFMALFCAAVSAETTTHIRIKGSDTMFFVAQAWSEEYQYKARDVAISVGGGGSGTGFSAAGAGVVVWATCCAGAGVLVAGFPPGTFRVCPT